MRETESGIRDMNALIEKYGNKLIIKNCLVGRNLNQIQIRGFASLEMLSDLSSADVYDQKLNQYGTQRDLQNSHAQEAYKYAIDSANVDPSVDARAFPEVILNVRETGLVSFYQDGNLISFDDIDSEYSGPFVCDIDVDLSLLTFPAKQFEPEISRVDGNHRLSSVPSFAKREDTDFPEITFALFIGLSKDQERKIFADINGKQKSMNTSHLTQILINQKGLSALYSDSTRSAWFARELTLGNNIFEGKVYMGGSKKGIKKETGGNLPITFAALTTMMKHTSSGLKTEILEQFPSEKCKLAENGDEIAIAELEESANGFIKLYTFYWEAVSIVFPEAWNDMKKTTYLLFDSVGNVAMSMLGAEILREVIHDESATSEDLVKEKIKEAVMNLKHARITLKRDDYPGYAGLAGSKKLFEKLIDAKANGSSGVKKLMNILKSEQGSRLDRD